MVDYGQFMVDYGLVVFLSVPLFEKGQILFDNDSLMFGVPFCSVSTKVSMRMDDKDASEVALWCKEMDVVVFRFFLRRESSL